jgi:hypothetical protein
MMMSARSLDAPTRAPITMSPPGKVDPGAGCNPLITGYAPGDPDGLAPVRGEGDGEAGGGSTVGVTVWESSRAPASVGGGPLSRRVIVPAPPWAPSRGRPMGLCAHAASSKRAKVTAQTRHSRTVICLGVGTIGEIWLTRACW